MKLYFNGRIYEFSLEQLDLMYENEGSEAIIYRFFDREVGKVFALKIYKDFCGKDRLDEATTKKLMSIVTKRFLLPEDVIYDASGKFIGYVMDYCKMYSVKNLPLMKMDWFLKELDFIFDDVFKLSSENVDIDDLHFGNTIYSDGIYIADPGSFIIDKDSRYVLSNNKMTVNRYILEELVFNLIPLTKKEKNKLREELPINEDPIVEILNSGRNSTESLKKFIKRICK